MVSPRLRHTASAAALVSLATGLGLALVVSGGVLAQRLTRGEVHVAVGVELAGTLAALALFYVNLVSGRRGAAEGGTRDLLRTRAASPARLASLVWQAVGASAGIVVAHAALHASRFGALPWLSEAPGQFVNDAVAVFAPLAIVWASSRRPPRTAVLAMTLGFVTVYRLTAVRWHLDGGAFAMPVQDLVSGQFAASALGVTVFRALIA